METAVVATFNWSPNQLRSLEVMGLDTELRSVGTRPVYDGELPVRLREQLENLVAPVIDAHDYTREEPLVVAKFDLGEVLRCERRYVEVLTETFAWSLPKARGTILHKAQQASVTRRGAAVPVPVIVEQAIDCLRRDEGASIGSWLQGLSDFELEELVVDVTECLVKLRADLPPLQPRWQPRIESRVRVELCDSRFVLNGRFDLALGMPCGFEARALIADFKTGGTRVGHHDELRFYALLEVFRSKVPPWRAAVYYADLGEWTYVDIDEAALVSAIRRVADGARKMAELSRGTRPPRPCRVGCSFCI